MTTGRADELRLIRYSLLSLLILALLYTAFVAADLLIPIVIAVFLSVLLFPLVRLGEQIGLPELMGKTAIIVFLTFFFVLTGKNWLLKATRCGHTWGQRRRIVVIGRNIQKDITIYLGTVTIINASLGATTALFLWLIGVPDPLMWGLLVAALNFAPYAGALLAVPILVSFKAFCDHYPPMRFAAYFLTNDKRLKHQASG